MKITLSARMKDQQRFPERTLGIAQLFELQPGFEAEDALVYTDDNGLVTTLVHNCSVEAIQIDRNTPMGKFYSVHKSKEQL